jgi:hypothetical protein
MYVCIYSHRRTPLEAPWTLLRVPRVPAGQLDAGVLDGVQGPVDAGEGPRAEALLQPGLEERRGGLVVHVQGERIAYLIDIRDSSQSQPPRQCA